jgi:hypothetical protein
MGTGNGIGGEQTTTNEQNQTGSEVEPRGEKRHGIERGKRFGNEAMKPITRPWMME